MSFLYGSSYIFVLVGLLVSLWASWNVKRTFKKYSQYGNSKHVRAEQAAQMILRQAGITDVRIERVRGDLTDHYSPKEKVLRLSDSVYGSESAAAIGVAAHECGHAIQHNKGYMPLAIRSAVIPAANIGSKLSYPVILLGLIFGATGLLNIGTLLFSLVVLLQLVTLPVEFDASNRAMKILDDSSILYSQELNAARKVLFAAALTYVAALLTSVLQLIRLILLRRRR
ncbi:zinc metallopeptidase [Butyrivibrio sp. AC2005]|uniref:zinc metallopeptidase n=1 Tax=Butyrivibrio sp. AC2005 TaxID=1280672 RepID=UPI000407A780|nr:zinc metallopeptidase [Butyrivibrio sp. AC2005]